MKAEYAAWIAENVTETYGTCCEITERMAAAFPNLTRIRGHYYCWSWGERAHWWLVDGEEIVDPTAAQFPSKGCGEYVPWVEGSPEPTGYCPNCGGTVYDGNTCCSERCHDAYVAYCSNPGAY